MAKPVHWEPGTEAKFTYESLDTPPWPNGIPVDGDLMASEAGAAYVLEEVRPIRGNPRKVKILAARLEYGSLEVDGEGVWPLQWGRR